MKKKIPEIRHPIPELRLGFYQPKAWSGLGVVSNDGHYSLGFTPTNTYVLSTERYVFFRFQWVYFRATPTCIRLGGLDSLQKREIEYMRANTQHISPVRTPSERYESERFNDSICAAMRSFVASEFNIFFVTHSCIDQTQGSMATFSILM